MAMSCSLRKVGQAHLSYSTVRRGFVISRPTAFPFCNHNHLTSFVAGTRLAVVGILGHASSPAVSISIDNIPLLLSNTSSGSSHPSPSTIANSSQLQLGLHTFILQNIGSTVGLVAIDISNDEGATKQSSKIKMTKNFGKSQSYG